jgi:hypothetical protein
MIAIAVGLVAVEQSGAGTGDSFDVDGLTLRID